MFYYRRVTERLCAPEIGSYTSFGILALRCSGGRWQKLFLISDVSPNDHLVDELARLCTEYQLHPIHLYDVVEDTI